MRNPKRNSSTDSLTEEQTLTSTSGNKKQKMDKTSAPVRKRSTSRVRRSSNSKLRPKAKASTSTSGSKKRERDKSAAPVRKRRTSQAQMSSNGSLQSKTRAKEEKVGKKKALGKKDREVDTETNNKQVLQRVSMTDIKNEVTLFVRSLYGKKQEQGKATDLMSVWMLPNTSKTESSPTSKGDIHQNKTSGSTKGAQNVPIKTAPSDPKFKMMQDIMYS